MRRFSKPRPRVIRKAPRVSEMQASQINVALSGRFVVSGRCWSPARQYVAEASTSISTSTKATAILLSSRRKSTKLCSP